MLLHDYRISDIDHMLYDMKYDMIFRYEITCYVSDIDDIDYVLDNMKYDMISPYTIIRYDNMKYDKVSMYATICYVYVRCYLH